MRASEYLIDIDAHDGTSVVTLRVSTCGYVTSPTDTPANAIYIGCVSDPGTFEASLFGAGRTMGQSEVGYGDITLINADGALNAWIGYSFNGRRFVVRRIASQFSIYSTAEIVMTGTLQALDADDARTSLRLRIYDRRLVLDKPLQTVRYAGTTTSGGPTAEGNVDLKDSVKPLVFGKAWNVPATKVNPFDLIYQVNDGPVSSIVAYDGGAPLDPAADYASIAALQGAAITPGTFATCKTLGLFRLGWQPEFDVTADVTEGATLAERYPAAIVARILAKMGLTPADYGSVSFAAMDVSAPMECGIYIDDERTALAVASDILGSVGGAMFPDEFGVFQVGRVIAPASPAIAITENNVLRGGDGGSVTIVTNPDTDGGVPAWRIVVQYRHVWRVQENSQLAGCVSEDMRTFVGTEWRDEVAENAAIKVRNLLSPEITIQTALSSQANAQSEASRHLALYGLDRFVIAIDVDREIAAEAHLGAVVNAILPVGMFEGGRPMLVIGRSDKRAEERATLTLWG